MDSIVSEACALAGLSVDTIRILHLEDVAADAELVREGLAAGGIACEVTRVDTREAFLAALAKEGFDIILSDFAIPGFSGASALADASRLASDVPFVVVSGTLGEDAAIQMLKLGASDYVLKDRPARLAPAVRRALREAEQLRAKHRAEASLRESQDFIRRVAEASPNAMMVFDLREERLIFVAGAVERVLGYTREQLLEMGPAVRRRMFHPRDVAQTPERLAVYQTARDGQIIRHLVRMRRPDASWCWIDQRSTVFRRDPDGSVRQILSISADVTGEKRGEQRRAAQYEVTREIAEGLTLGEAGPRILRAICESLEFAAGEWWELESAHGPLMRKFAWSSAAPVRASLSGVSGEPGPNSGMAQRAFSEGRVLRLTPELEVVAATQTRELCAALAFPLRAGSSSRGAIVCTSAEILHCDDDLSRTLAALGTQIGDFIVRNESEEARKKTVRRLAESEAQYRQLFDNNPQPMWVFDRESLAFLAVNDAAMRHYGYSREEFLGMTLSDIRPPEEVPAFREVIRTVLNEGSPSTTFATGRGVRKHRTKDGRLIDVEIARSSIRYAGRPALLALVNDVTEKKALEAQFLQAQKMESVGRLAGGVAHDFNNLLGVITGYGQLLLKQAGAEEKPRRYAESILEAASRATGLTRQLLAFSRQQVAQPQVLDLNAVVTGSQQMLQRLLGEDVEVRTALAKDLGRAQADPHQIDQILMNLVVNARDAMPKGGRLTIETANADLDADYARQHAEVEPGPYVMLAVSDTGHGMAPEVRAHIFEPFFTTKETGKGTGLGLGTVYGIVKQSGGHIWVYSEPGHGSTFKIYLPRVEAAPTARPAEAAAPLPRGSETILFVEDELALREVVSELLESLGYTVLGVSSGAEALAVAERPGQPLQLVITDVVLPGIGGRELGERLASVRPGVRLLYVSGYTDDAVVRYGVKAGEMAFLQKPFTSDMLARKVREVLEGPLG